MSKTILSRRGFVMTSALGVAVGCRAVTHPESSLIPVSKSNLSRQATKIVRSPQRIWDLLPEDTRRFLKDQGISLNMLDDFQTDDATWSIASDGETAEVTVRQEWTGACYIQSWAGQLWVDALPATELQRVGQFVTGAPDAVDTVENLRTWLNESPENLKRLAVGFSHRDDADEPLPLSALSGIGADPATWTRLIVTATPHEPGTGVYHLRFQCIGRSFPVVVQVSSMGLVTGVLRIDGQVPLQFFTRQIGQIRASS
jgi:hypothetical protein